MRENQMRPVTVRARRSDCQTFFEQPLAVDALAVVFDDVVFADIVDTRNGRPFAMATAAKERDVHLVREGVDVAWRENIVDAVAVIALRGVRSFSLQRLPVTASVKIELSVIVAISTENLFKVFFVGEIFNIGIHMTVDTFEITVDRFLKNTVVDEYGYFLSLHFLGEVLVGMTVETRFVVGCHSCKRPRDKYHKYA